MNDQLRPTGDARKGQGGLPEAIVDAELLIRYITLRNNQLDTGAVKDVLTTKKEMLAGDVKVETETAFWQALTTLSVAAAPATPTTIRARGPLTKEGRSAFGRFFAHVWQRYRLITFIFLAATILLNCYWLVASRTLDNLTLAYTELDKSVSERNKVKTLIDALKSKATKTPAEADTLATAQNQLVSLEVDSKNIQTKIDSHRSVLGYILPFVPMDKGAVAEITLGYLREVIGLTFLPLVLGGLGSCVFVVRKINDLARLDAFDPDTNYSFRLRVSLGCIAGLAAAQFQFFEDSKLTPLAFAFLAGYGIELFFTALDRLVGAFSARDKDKDHAPS